jgi:hypothetical protein
MLTAEAEGLALPEVALLYIDACPNWRVTDDRLREAPVRMELEDVSVEYRKVATPEEVEAVQFRGSPTVLVDGRDPFLDRDRPVGRSCRIYGTDDGLSGAPSVEQLVAVLR